MARNQKPRYVTHQTNASTFIIQDLQEVEIFMFFVNKVTKPHANHQIIISAIDFNDSEEGISFTKEVYSSFIYCADNKILSALIKSMLNYLTSDFEIANPVEYASELGGFLYSQPINYPSFRRGLS